MEPRVVRLKRKGGVVVQDCSLYIGRALNMGGWRLQQSMFANPFSVKQHGENAVPMYRDYLRKKVLEDPDTWVPAILGLEGHTLGCWCHPAPCHGDVLVDFYTRLKSIFSDKTSEKSFWNCVRIQQILGSE